MERDRVDVLEAILAAGSYSHASGFLSSACRENSEIIYIWFWNVSEERRVAYIPFVYEFLKDKYRLQIAQYIYGPERIVNPLYYD